jgi:hypothetical protein
VFEMTVDIICHAPCFGAVGNGIKFCTLGAGQCTFSSHAKKVSTKVRALYIVVNRNSAFAPHSIQASLLSPDQLSVVLMEKHTKEEWVFWKNQVGSSALGSGDRLTQGLVSAMKPPKRIHLEEPFGSSTNLNFKSFSFSENYSDDPIRPDEEDPGLVLLSSTSSEDKTPEEWLEDILQSWGSLVCTVSGFSMSIHAIQRNLSINLDSADAHISSLESMIGQCTEGLLKEDCITVWDALSFLHTGMDTMGKTCSESDMLMKKHIADINEKMRLSGDSTQLNFSDISKSFQDLVSFTKALSDEQAILSQRSTPEVGSESLFELKKKYGHLYLGSPAFRQPSTPCLQTTPSSLTPLRKLMLSRHT